MRILTSFILKSVLTLLVLSMMFSTRPISQAHAEESDLFKLPGQFSGTFGLFTDYRFRGVSQNDEDLAFQGSLDWSHDKGFYFGVWASNVDFGDSAQSELDTYFGVEKEYYGVTFDVGGIYYAYPGALDSINYDYFEFVFGMSCDLSPIAMSGTLYYSPENTGDSGNATYLSFDTEVPLLHGITMAGHVGRQWITNEAAFGKPDYVDWSVGLNYSTNGFDLSVAYVDTNLTAAECPKGCDSQAVFGITRSF